MGGDVNPNPKGFAVHLTAQQVMNLTDLIETVLVQIDHGTAYGLDPGTADSLHDLRWAVRDAEVAADPMDQRTLAACRNGLANRQFKTF